MFYRVYITSDSWNDYLLLVFVAASMWNYLVWIQVCIRLIKLKQNLKDIQEGHPSCRPCFFKKHPPTYNMVKTKSVEYFFNLLFLSIFILFFFKDYERSLRQLSLDDIERLAGRLLHPDGEGMDTSYMD